jgi:NH3-dependent NAD+ synthetase
MPVVDAKALIDERVGAIRRYHEGTGLDRAELDLSGGIDSAVMAGLLLLALGQEALTLSIHRLIPGPRPRIVLSIWRIHWGYL